MKRARIVLALAAAGLSLGGAGGCGSDATPGPACNTLRNDGPAVSVMASTATAPAPAGGTIVDGTYVLTAATGYAISPAVIPTTTLSAVMQIAGSTMQQAGTINGEERRYTSTLATSGTSVTTTDTCPAADSNTYRYTATTTSLRIYAALGASTLEQTYTKR